MLLPTGSILARELNAVKTRKEKGGRFPSSLHCNTCLIGSGIFFPPVLF